MSYKIGIRCTICMSPYKLEIEKLHVEEKKTLAETAELINNKYGTKISAAAIHRHLTRHFEFVSPALVQAREGSLALFNEQLMDASTRAVKISAMLERAYEIIKEKWADIDIDTAVKIFFSGTDALNKMEGIGVLDGNDFLTKFLQVLHEVKKPPPAQEIMTFETDESGVAETVQKTATPALIK